MLLLFIFFFVCVLIIAAAFLWGGSAEVLLDGDGWHVILLQMLQCPQPAPCVTHRLIVHSVPISRKAQIKIWTCCLDRRRSSEWAGTNGTNNCLHLNMDEESGRLVEKRSDNLKL